MSHTNVQHRRTHNLLLISKLLSQRDAASPFTLVLDSLEQTAKPLLREYIRRANLVKTYTVFLGFETVRPPAGVGCYVPCYNRTPGQIAQAVSTAIEGSGSKRHHLLIVDSLHPLCTLSQGQSDDNGFSLVGFLSALIAPPTQTPSQSQQTPLPTASLVAVYHTDIPLPHPTHLTHQYQPTPLSLVSYLATTIITTHNLAVLLAGKAAQDRSLAPPVYGLDEGKEGVVIGLKRAEFTKHLPPEQRGLVLELEHRRKSGRGVREWYFLPTPPSSARSTSGGGGGGASAATALKETVTLLDDHPRFRAQRSTDADDADAQQSLAGMTFELGLTQRQRAEREGVVLPYFDAQRDGGGLGPGEGGRILYDLGAEDDFDEEEDEI